MNTQIIDYRNARYQGQTKSGLPHGIGIMFDYKNLFTLAQWKNGQIHGRCLIIFGDSKIFYGSIRNNLPQEICTYHLKDKCQIFCNFHKKSSEPISKNLQQNDSKASRLVALLPSFNMIIKVEGDNEEELIISDEQVYREKDIKTVNNILQKMLNYKFQQNELDAYLSLEGFIRKMFTQKREYEGLLDTVQLTSPDGGKELYFTLKTKHNQSSLGIRIQNCMQDPSSMTNLHNDGHSYIVKSVGMFNKQGILQYGLKNIRTLIKGNVKQEAIYGDDKSIIRYENQASRPKKCSAQIMNYLKKSPHFTNKCMATRHLYILQAQCLNINFNIKETQTKKYAQLILQNPKQFTMEQKQSIEKVRNRKINNEPVQKNSNTPSKDRKNEKYQNNNQQLLLAKQDIYRSVSKKKINGTAKSSPYVHAGTNLSSSPEKDIKPAQLTNVKPILQLYKNTGDNSFYNSINKNGSSSNFTNDKNSQGYQFSITKKIDTNFDAKTPPPKHGGSMSADYIKSLQNRRRLYEESDLNQMPSVTQQAYNGNGHMSRRKFHYLPDESEQISNRPVTHKLNYKKNITKGRFDDTNDNELSFYTQSGYNEPQQSVYDPHKHYHDHSNPIKSEENFYRSQRREGEKSRSISKQDGQAGKLGRRVTNKQRPLQGQSSFLQGSHNNNRSQKKLNPYEPIIVPEFKINHTNIPSDYKRPIIDVSMSPNPKRQHQLKVPSQPQYRKSPLKTEVYRKEYLDNNSPIRKLGSNYDAPQSKYKYEYDVVMDPGANFAKSRMQRDTKYPIQTNDRSRSPLPKRKKILSDNPFDL